MTGQLFTQYFLTEGIQDTEAWQESVRSPQRFSEFRQSLGTILSRINHANHPNEAATELDIIRPILGLLDWGDYLPQQGSGGNEDIPDHLLFADAAAKDRANARQSSADRYQDALVIQESKRYGLPLDNRDQQDRAQRGTPHGQILRYLSTAESATGGHVRWGILTNGAVWRLYDFRARPRASGFYEADLHALLQPDESDADALRAFYLLFRRAAFTPQAGATTTFLEDAIAEGRRYEQRVAEDLSQVVFTDVFPRLVAALAAPGAGNAATSDDLATARHAALIFLYRLLFILYAEDRNLLPVNDDRYDDYGLRIPVRDHIAARMDARDTFSDVAANYYNRLANLFMLIDQGDPSIGLPPYNGGLFAPDAAPLLESVRLSDAVVAPIIYALSHTRTVPKADASRPFVNYRDMSVQQLGSIYERLLEREPVPGADGALTLRPNPYARKDSGSFYTPQELVDLIVEKTLEPLVEERLQAFEAKAAQLKRDRRTKADRLRELQALDPAVAALDLKILDPAMGSGHFLVTAVDFLSDYIADLVEYVPGVPAWLDDGYVSPLVARIAALRQDILRRAEESRWTIDAAQLTDQAIIRRMVLKRCIYGVDKNPLAVELAKVALWLHSFTVGAPLSFLDHHLRCGDSLLGLRVSEAVGELRQRGGFFVQSAVSGAEAATEGMKNIELLSDADVSEVRKSASLFVEVEETTADLRGLLDVLCGLRWLTAGMKKKERETFEAPLLETLDRHHGDPFKLLAHGPDALSSQADGSGAESPLSPRERARVRGNPSASASLDSGFHRSDEPQAAPSSGSAGSHGTSAQPASGAETTSASEFTTLWQRAKTIADRETFLHWEVAFPGVWAQWQDARPAGGFDAVIGNPPWDRIKLQEVEWFATRAPELARAPTAAARREAIKGLRAQGDPLAADFDAAKARADGLGKLVRASGHYPLLGGGDVNLYSLFVERALRLVKAEGLVGLLTPSGIYADKTAAKFFQSVSTRGRVAGLFDFENRRLGTDLPPFFPDVDSRFKFCALIVGGTARQFDETACAFFLHDKKTIEDDDRCFPLTPDDFARVNPNTGTAPVFRTRRDADITRAIYARHPVLVDRSDVTERKTWPVKYVRMFDMTNDSHLFRTAAQLDEEGFYPVQGNRWQRGKELYLPLYEGKMVQAFDHRAASVVVNPENLNRPAQPRDSLLEQHADPNWLPDPQFWVYEENIEWPQELSWAVGFKDVTAPTNVRTMIASIVPRSGFGNTLPLLMPDSCDLHRYTHNAWLWTACLNSFALDYVARQKVQGQHLNWFVVEQLPVIAPDAYDRKFGETTARALIRDHVLKLTYTAHDLAPFARDLGYAGPPFIWDEEERRHLRARLDACYFHLYGISRPDAAYILSTFPIVQRQDQAAFGSFRTQYLILAYMNALTAGDTKTIVDL
ncbi:MAG: restriction endonuclease [Chloroflexi bacterium]|nr:restriction endonuclease [Chloroflexota bacterium]